VDFAKVLDTVTRFLDERGLRYALVGAFALSAYGFSRATQDIDFAVDSTGRRDLISFLESLGYETLHQHILGLPGVDMDEIRGHFERYGLLERFHELRKILDADRP
jgi:hypothetical protein